MQGARQQLLASVRASGLLPAGSHVLVAVSGGLDSMVLLHLLRFDAESAAFTLSAAHFDHRMRAGSEGDAAWVRGICEAWRVPLIEGAAAESLRGEAAARTARYAFLQRAAAGCGASRIATAHHRDDQAETVVLRVLRGTGLDGLSGIAARRGRIVRPLLEVPRALLYAYARGARLRWREDPSNRDLRYLRNRVRRLLLPGLEKASPGASARLAALAGSAALAGAAGRGLVRPLAHQVLEGRREGALLLARQPLLGYDPPVRARVLRYWARRLGSPLDRAATERAAAFLEAGRSGRTLPLGKNLRLAREFDQFLLFRPVRRARRPEDRPLCIAGPGRGTGQARIGGRTVRVQWGPGDVASGSTAAAFDPDALRFPLELRGPRAGDAIGLEYGTKKLKKLLAERRIGRSRRAAVPVLAEQTAGGRVLWIAGVERAAGARVRAGAPAWHVTVEHEHEH